LAIDIGGTGLKATVLDPAGKELVPRVRVDTRYPMPPEALLAALHDLIAPLPPRERASVGFPGVVRGGLVLTAPHFVTAKGPGTRVVPKLVKAWDRYPLAARLEEIVGVPVRLANDADLQGSAVVSGTGLELVLTLGTGLGSALFQDGRLCCHLELAHHPFQKDESYNDRIGDAARKRIGTRKWNRRVAAALAAIDALLVPDRIYIGGGNAVHVRDPGPKVTIVSNEAGLLGGITLWSGPAR
jgi:polyphosphate glucokinase